MNRITLLIIAGFTCLIMALLGTGIGLFYITPAEEGGRIQTVVVEEGLSLKEVAIELEKRRIIASRLLFELWAKFTGSTRKIKAGEYRLGPSMAPNKILGILTKGAVITHSVTIPEGFTMAQVAEALERSHSVRKKEFLSVANDPALLERYGISGPSLEGYLYPETYHFARGLSASSTVDAMVRRFWKVVGPFKGRVDEVEMRLEEVITLASIVEKETGRAEERPIIASVFLNRLKRGMRLESDPTVIYGLRDFKGNLTRKDLKNPTPYNTYVIRGLPPGPIANPGLDAIKAVLYPARTDYLYFVSKNDGSHYFSKTLEEHNRAVRIYQKKGRKRRRKTS